ncbi:MAG: glycosyltransferase family 2 protein, partial [Deltaproteobacteria bacterium]
MGLYVVFFGSLLILFYVYAGYPLLVVVLGRLRNRGVKKGAFAPTVTILIAARNERASIRKTLTNLLAADYPQYLIEIIVISDGSTDGTDEIVQEFAPRGVRLIRQEPRAGKTAALNLAAPQAKGEILVFADANSEYAPEALAELMANFKDPAVGYVTGKMIYADPEGTTIGDGCSAFMKYENFLRLYETKVGSIFGVDGGIDAVRRALFHSMKADQLPDFVLPLHVVEQGFRVIYEPKAILRETTLQNTEDEYRMRVRVALRALWAIRDMRRLLNPFRFGLFSLQFWSHKVLRYLAFFFLPLAYGANLALLGKDDFYTF